MECRVEDAERGGASRQPEGRPKQQPKGGQCQKCAHRGQCLGKSTRLGNDLYWGLALSKCCAWPSIRGNRHKENRRPTKGAPARANGFSTSRSANGPKWRGSNRRLDSSAGGRAQKRVAPRQNRAEMVTPVASTPNRTRGRAANNRMSSKESSRNWASRANRVPASRHCLDEWIVRVGSAANSDRMGVAKQVLHLNDPTGNHSFASNAQTSNKFCAQLPAHRRAMSVLDHMGPWPRRANTKAMPRVISAYTGQSRRKRRRSVCIADWAGQRASWKADRASRESASRVGCSTGWAIQRSNRA